VSASLTDALAIDVLLTDGGIAGIRPVQPSDEHAMRDLNSRVSLRTRRMRFFSTSERPGDWYVDRVLEEPSAGCALVAEVAGHVVALASFARSERDPQLADLGMLVDDQHQKQGLGALLLEHLAGLAKQAGITALTADVLAENSAMLRLLQDSGFALTSTGAGGVVELRIELAARPELLDAVTRREIIAERASLRPLLEPSAIAVVGSVRPRSIASEVWTALQHSGYHGALRRVGPGQQIGGGPQIDLVIVAVPAADVLGVARQAADAGARALCVLSAGFAENGADGRQRQEELLSLCRTSGLRLVGPNCLGLVSTAPHHRFNATFCDAHPRSGGIALISQSGAVGIAALRHAERRGAGLSAFVSTGNKADVSGNDLLAWFSEDPRTTTIALYLESFGNARKFARVAAAVGRHKPVVVVKAGRTAAGAQAGQSHTAAAATPDVAIEALLRGSGVIRAENLSEMFDVLTVLDAPVLPSGSRVAVIGNSGGPGVLAADACTAAGLTLAELSTDTRAALQEIAADGAAFGNPIDLLATVTPEAFQHAIQVVAADPAVDVVVTIYTPLLRGAEEKYAAALARVVHAHPDVCVVATFPGVAWAPAALPSSVPFFELPEDAVHAVGKVMTHVRWRDQVPHRQIATHPDTAHVRALLTPLVDEEPRWLDPREATQLLERLGIPCARVVEVHDAAAATAAASDLGYPVALKAFGPELVHKRERGGVILGLRNQGEVIKAYRALTHRLGDEMDGVVVQAMSSAHDGVELLVGLAHDDSVGPLVAVGLGGTLSDVVDDRAVRLPSASPASALEQLADLRCAKLFGSTASRAALDIDEVARVVCAVGALAETVPEVRELDLNPLLVTPNGVLALDVKVRVALGRSDQGIAQRDLSTVPRPRSTP
jgi:acyl-CoA synthetase (NDP forming)/GNAT superfamily N-acetyltransferase